MSRKNSKEIPEKSKAGVTSDNNSENALPPQASDGAEYICGVFFYYNQSVKKQEYRISIETLRHFSTLKYELSLDIKKSKNVIDIHILGLKPVNAYLTDAGQACSVIPFEELYGKHTVNVFRNDGSVNSAVFDFNIFKKKIELIEEFEPQTKNNKKFCNFRVNEDKFTFMREGNS